MILFRGFQETTTEETLDGLDGNLREVISMIIGDGAPKAVGDLVGTEVVAPG